MEKVTLTLPDGGVVHAIHICELEMTNLTIQAHIVYIVPKMKINSLISVRKLCAAGCLVQFIDAECTVYFHNKFVLQGNKNFAKNLCMIPTTKTNTEIHPTPNIIPPGVPHPPNTLCIFSNLVHSIASIKFIN